MKVEELEKEFYGKFVCTDIQQPEFAVSPDRVWEWIESKVSQVEKPVICSEAKSLCETKYTEREILTAIRIELTKAFEEDSNPEDLQDKIYTTQGYIICALKNFASKPEPNGI